MNRNLSDTSLFALVLFPVGIVQASADGSVCEEPPHRRHDCHSVRAIATGLQRPVRPRKAFTANFLWTNKRVDREAWACLLLLNLQNGFIGRRMVKKRVDVISIPVRIQHLRDTAASGFMCLFGEINLNRVREARTVRIINEPHGRAV
jgi:hypothetical protein